MKLKKVLLLTAITATLTACGNTEVKTPQEPVPIETETVVIKETSAQIDTDESCFRFVDNDFGVSFTTPTDWIVNTGEETGLVYSAHSEDEKHSVQILVEENTSDTDFWYDSSDLAEDEGILKTQGNFDVKVDSSKGNFGNVLFEMKTHDYKTQEGIAKYYAEAHTHKNGSDMVIYIRTDSRETLMNILDCFV